MASPGLITYPSYVTRRSHHVTGQATGFLTLTTKQPVARALAALGHAPTTPLHVACVKIWGEGWHADCIWGPHCPWVCATFSGLQGEPHLFKDIIELPGCRGGWDLWGGSADLLGLLSDKGCVSESVGREDKPDICLQPPPFPWPLRILWKVRAGAHMLHFLIQINLYHLPSQGVFLLGGSQWLRQEGLHPRLKAETQLPCKRRPH